MPTTSCRISPTTQDAFNNEPTQGKQVSEDPDMADEGTRREHHGGGDRHRHDAEVHRHDETGRIRRLVGAIGGGHHHDRGESVASALETSQEGMRALKISLAGLAVTAVLQALVVTLSGSVALLADTVHNVTDALTAVPLGIAFWLARRSPTKRYTYGFGRAEDLAGIFIVLAIALSAGIAGREALQRLFQPQPVENVSWVVVAGIVGFAGNELVALYRIRVGRRIGSAALVADGLHARTDGLTSLAVVAAGLGSALGWRHADPVVGLAITVAILLVLKEAAREVYRRLMDSVDPDLVDRVAEVVRSVDGVEAVDTLRLRWVGHRLEAEAEIVCDSELSIAHAHQIAEEVHHRLLHYIPRMSRVAIHTSPCGHDGVDHHSTTAHHFSLSS